MKEGYKKTAIGEIPEDWRVTSIKDTGEIISGGTPSTTETAYWEGNILWCTPTDITALKGKKYISKTARCISEEGVKNSSATMIGPNSLIICTRATLGYSAINLLPVTTNQGFKSIIPNQNVDVEFLFYTISNIRSTIERLASGSTFLEISKKAFEGIKIAVPTLPEQQKIAEILSTVDEKIEVIGEQINQTQELKRCLMQRLLTKGIGHTLFKDSPLGRIPGNWEFGKVSDFIEVHNHLRKPISAEERKGMQGNYPYYGPTGIVDYINEYQVEGKYVLIGEDGDHFLKYNKWPMTQLVSGKFNVNNHAHLMKGDSNCSTDWIHYFYQHRDIISRLTRQGAGRYKLTKATLLTLPFLLPPINEQKKITDILFTVDGKLEVLQDKKKQYQELKKGLMQQLLTGKIRVTNLLTNAVPA